MRYIVNVFAVRNHGKNTYSGYRVADTRTGCLIATYGTREDAQTMCDTLNARDPYRDLR